MTKSLFFLLAMFFMISVNAQETSIKVLGNIDRNLLSEPDNQYSQRTSNLGTGYSLRLSFNQLKIGEWTFGFGFGYHELSGGLHTESGGLGGGATMDLTYQKQLISMAIFPLCFSSQNFHLNAGIEGTALLNETLDGTIKSWTMYDGVSYHNIDEKTYDINGQNNIGININASYNFYLYEGFGVSPYLSMFLGVTNELDMNALKGYPLRFFNGISFFWKSKN
ncbi:MAG: hypothetical protein ACOCPM_03620 [Bacteroidales bacterium]